MRKAAKFTVVTSLGLALNGVVTAADTATSQPLPAEAYCHWQQTDLAINEPLCGLHGDPVRGRAIATDGNRGNCVACHVMPLDNVEGYGTIGPSLAGIGGRYPEGYIRLRVVDTKSFNPASIMPGYYRDPAKINRPAKMFEGRTFLTAQQVEDVIAFLMTMK
ncbi:MAG: sulfur oxidation c-type cytochrome SoxX [Gammaproteobacteria bacterium]|nr:sulfur oxidation c-type cytochrome SoxX [Gammaproteobacteria bacterium]